MIIAIHQPNYLPWLGYFYKMAKADLFILLDNIQYEINGYINRCRIKTSQNSCWLTLPVKRKFPQMITEAKLVNYDKEKRRHIKTIMLNYHKAEYFDYLFPELKGILEKKWEYLSDLNIELIRLLKEKLSIKTKIEISSDYRISGKNTDLLAGLCKKFEANTYLSGKGGQNYQDEKKFEKSGIQLTYTKFVHPKYKQLWGSFIPRLSIIDLIFNYGPESLKILLKT